MKHGKAQRIHLGLFYMMNQIYIEGAHLVIRRKGVNSNSNNTPRAIAAKLLDYIKREEIMRRRYKLIDTTYSVREDFSKETVEIRKRLWDQVERLREGGKWKVCSQKIRQIFPTYRQYVFFGVKVLFFRLFITIYLK